LTQRLAILTDILWSSMKILGRDLKIGHELPFTSFLIYHLQSPFHQHYITYATEKETHFQRWIQTKLLPHMEKLYNKKLRCRNIKSNRDLRLITQNAISVCSV
jgi:hypothetical protein